MALNTQSVNPGLSWADRGLLCGLNVQRTMSQGLLISLLLSTSLSACCVHSPEGTRDVSLCLLPGCILPVSVTETGELQVCTVSSQSCGTSVLRSRPCKYIRWVMEEYTARQCHRASGWRSKSCLLLKLQAMVMRATARVSYVGMVQTDLPGE